MHIIKRYGYEISPLGIMCRGEITNNKWLCKWTHAGADVSRYLHSTSGCCCIWHATRKNNETRRKEIGREGEVERVGGKEVEGEGEGENERLREWE